MPSNPSGDTTGIIPGTTVSSQIGLVGKNSDVVIVGELISRYPSNPALTVTWSIPSAVNWDPLGLGLVQFTSNFGQSFTSRCCGGALVMTSMTMMRSLTWPEPVDGHCTAPTHPHSGEPVAARQTFASHFAPAKPRASQSASVAHCSSLVSYINEQLAMHVIHVSAEAMPTTRPTSIAFPSNMSLLPWFAE